MKKQLIVSYIFLLAILSSCGVYSLFPIYTKDTLVERKEIMGKWLSETEGSYLTFTRISYNIKAKESGNKKNIDNLKISFSGDEDSDILDTGKYVIENGDTTIMKDTLYTQFGTLLENKLSKLQGLDGSQLTKKSDTYYVMSYYEDDEKVASFKAHLVKIGEDYFIDMLPKGGLDDDNGATENYFPVHTFLKFKLDNDHLEIKMFDQSKLKDLFKSNLIRLRHEIVDDKVLITAQPKEIQKFLEKYSRDESVFEDITVYTKANS